MSQLLSGSICLTTLIEKAKQQHSAFSKSTKDGKIYVNIKAWLNEEPNEYGQHMSIQLNSLKEKKDEEGNVYIGNCKKLETSAPVSVKDLGDTNFDIKESEPKKHYSSVSGQVDDLPF